MNVFVNIHMWHVHVRESCSYLRHLDYYKQAVFCKKKLVCVVLVS